MTSLERRQVGGFAMAFIMTHELTLGTLRDYVKTLFPVAASFLLVPTLSCAAGREPLPVWPQVINRVAVS